MLLRDADIIKRSFHHATEDEDDAYHAADLALIASSVAVGYAGGGGAGGPGGPRFPVLPGLRGPNPPHVLEVNDEFIDPTVEKIGKLKFVCSFNPSVAVAPGSPGVSPSPQFDSLTCYEAPGANSKDVVTYTDHLFETPQTAKVGPCMSSVWEHARTPTGADGW